MPVSKGCELMGVPRSTYYDTPDIQVHDSEIVARIRAGCDKFETDGYRRVGAALRYQGLVESGKKVRRLMCPNDLQPQRRKRFVTTTDSTHNLPVFPHLARGLMPNGPNQFWVRDMTYIAVATGFVYVALVVDAWSQLRHGAIHRHTARRGGSGRGRRITSTYAGVHPPFEPWQPICLQPLLISACPTRVGWLNEPAG